MKIAIAGFGSVAKYLIEVFSQSRHSVVVLARSERSAPEYPTLEQRTTTYSVEDLTLQLKDCDAIVSTLSGPEDFFISAHLAILEACRRSPKCKRFLPSEFSVNIKDFPDLPTSLQTSRGKVRAALRAQNEIKWTLICSGWFMDYLVPPQRRYLPDLGLAFAVDTHAKTFEMYGDGQQKVSLTSARDVARVILGLLEADTKEWNEFSFITAQTLTFVELFTLVKKRDPEYELKNLTFSMALESILKPANSDERLLADLRILGYTNAFNFPEAQRLKWGTGILEGVIARDIEAFLAEADSNKDGIL